MANFLLLAQVREEKGTSLVKKLRRSEIIPAVVYGPGKDNLAVSINSRELNRALASGVNLIQLDLNGNSKTVIVKDINREPVKGDVLHVDFYEVDMNKAISTTAPIRVVGEDQRENDGGILNLVLRELALWCLPAAIPHHIEVDVAGLKIGDSLQVKDLTAPVGVEFETDGEETVLSITEPAAPEEEPGEESVDEEVAQAADEAEEETEQ